MERCLFTHKPRDLGLNIIYIILLPGTPDRNGGYTTCPTLLMKNDLK